MPWKKGQSGNPAGRKPKTRPLTAVLKTAINHAVILPDGTKVNGKRYLAGMLIEALTTGSITLANGNIIELSPEDVMMFTKFMYSQIDGPPPQELKHEGEDGGPIHVLVEYAGNGDTE